jgi:hypothetical protein
MKLNVGDVLFESLSENIGTITKIFDHPDGKIVKVRWQIGGHLPHDTEHTYKKLLRCVKNGDYELTSKDTINSKTK